MIYEEAVVLTRPFDQAVADVKAALAAEGFGTLTEIDMQATLREKIGKEIGPHVIVGACNPHLAGRALDIEPQIGALLPCNVVIRETEGNVLVEVTDPKLMATISGKDELEPIAAEARERINAALLRLAEDS